MDSKAADSGKERLHWYAESPILAVNTDKEIWGEDARESKSERWESLPDTVGLVPGVWANLLTFFAGTTNCIGFRLSLIEHVSPSSLTQSPPPLRSAMERRAGIRPKMVGLFQTPVVLGEEEKGSALPLIVKPYIAQ
ncbi:hypothetical protein B0H14DRAFT_3425482 [Mycena olivaceomarginata]|nr:hypothetical protein B0H14DRAFT_3425482 [Mycena olivaceomarginata]